jgi:hypothetical protein
LLAKCEEITERFPLHWFVPKRFLGFWLSSIPAGSSDLRLEQRFLLADRFFRFDTAVSASSSGRFEWILHFPVHFFNGLA